MLQINKLGILLHKTKIPFESEGVLNPALIRAEGAIHMFYRAVAEGNYSSVGYCTLSAPMEISGRLEVPMVSPKFPYENQGIEDPRIVAIEGTYYLTYTAYDGINALGALATSTDLIHWQKKGILVPQLTYPAFKEYAQSQKSIHDKYERYNDYQGSHEKHKHPTFIWDKNLIFFPRKIDNGFCFLHRIKPEIQIVTGIKNLENLTSTFWQNYLSHFEDHVLLSPKYEHETSYIGGGCPPVETPEGWLLIYHAVKDTVKGYVYTAGAALLHLQNPRKVLGRLPYPLFFPEKEWELNGEVNNVCFPTGTIVEGDTLYIYYGAADERIAVASVSITALLAELLKNKTNNNNE